VISDDEFDAKKVEWTGFEPSGSAVATRRRRAQLLSVDRTA
jgi:hypothetical protein